MTDSPKRPGTMSDDDRANIGREHRRAATPVGGVRVVQSGELSDFDNEDFTPITDILALVETERERERTILLWRHIRNVEMRSRARAGTGVDIAAHIAEDAEVHRELAEKFADVHGVSGNNGKLGELRRRVDALSSKAWWLFTAFVGALGGALIKVVVVTRAFDSVEAKANHAEQQIQILHAQVLNLTTAALARPRYRPEPPAGSTAQP